jgi:environmental stress-induced protein Ves
MRIVRLADIPPAPWANGAGETRELWSALAPDGGGWDRRISVATLAAPAPFSPLPGVSRILLPLDDVAGTLAIDGRPVPLRRHVPIAFAGDAPVALTTLSRPGRVVNVMCLAARWRPILSFAPGTHTHAVAVILSVATWNGTTLAAGDLLAPAPSDTPPQHAAFVRFAAVQDN